MKSTVGRAVAILAVAIAVAACEHMPWKPGWTTLIDGNSGMENWTVSGTAANWRAEDGSIQADKTTGKGASVLVSKRTFKNLEIYAEFWAADETNSGIYFRAPDPKTVNTASGAFEVQIWDRNPNPKYSTGSLVNLVAVQPIFKAGGRWNTYEIYANGPEVVVKLNGVVTATTKEAKTHEGHIGLQFNSGPIKFRKLRVREL